MSAEKLCWGEWIQDVNDRREKSSLLRSPRVLHATDSSITITEEDGVARGKPVTLFSTNDYLGLSSHPDVKSEVSKAAAWYGNGTRAAAIVSGHSHIHEQLEMELASLKQTEACLLFPTGFAANFGPIAALCARGNVSVFSDELNHASLVDGMRAATRAGCRLHIFRHRDYRHLAELLSHADPSHRLLIVTDGVFSMDGDVADLRAPDIQELVRLKREANALLMVDDAHGTLVLGESGGGAAEASGTCHDIDLHSGTLSKAFGALGGFVACSAEMKKFLVNHARSYIYSTALPVPVAAGALAALHVFRRDSWLQQHLQRLMAKVANALRCEVATPIIPVIVGSENAALQLSQRLWHEGFHCPAIRPPTVPAGSSRLRITLTAKHTEADVDRLLHTLDKFGVLRSVSSRDFATSVRPAKLCERAVSSKL